MRSEAGGAEPGPLISVVIPVYGVEDSLHACLDSVLRQQLPEIEVIAVDDASPDASGDILDEYAKRDGRVRAVHLDRNGGPGNARNTGFDLARGDYVWFVDADDQIADGALAAIAGRLTAAGPGGCPDVLLIGFDRVQPSGRTEPNAWQHVLSAPSAPVFTLDDRPDVLKLTMTAWSKIIHRRFMAGLGLRFGPGIHEDVPVTCMLLLAAERISVLDRVCYHYREDRRGALTSTPSDDNFQIFSRYREVFDFLAKRHGGRVQLHAALFDRMIWHYTAVLGDRGCVPRRSRREFLRRAAGDFARYRPEGYSYPPGVHGIKYRLVERGSYALYMAAQPVNRARLALRPALRAAPSRATSGR